MEAATPLALRIRYFSEVGPRRADNQDNYYVLRHFNILSAPSMAGENEADTRQLQAFALFDGMGGEASGERASLLAADTMEHLLQALHNVLTPENLQEAFRSYYDAFMKKLSDYLEDDTSPCGTTFVGVFLKDRTLIPLWLGDSRGYLLRSGHLYRLTKDHSLAQEQIDRGLLTEDDAKSTRDWHTLTRYMGQYDAEFSIGEAIELLPGDRIILCSDGITDRYTDHQLQRLLRGSSRAVLKKLKQTAQTDADDNSTVILIDAQPQSLGALLKNYGRREA